MSKNGELLHIPKRAMFMYGETRSDWSAGDVLD